jgi:hypothetical protein
MPVPFSAATCQYAYLQTVYAYCQTYQESKVGIGMTKHESTSKYAFRRKVPVMSLFPDVAEVVVYAFSMRFHIVPRKYSVPMCFCVPCYEIKNLNIFRNMQLVAMS